MTTYHVARFEFERPAETLAQDLTDLQVEHTRSATAVWVPVPEGIDIDGHREALKSLSMGRGPVSVTRETA